MDKSTPSTPVVALIEHVYNHATAYTGKSCQRLNSALYRALRLAIECGFKFELEDFNTIYKRTNGGYWMGASYDEQGEDFYIIAVSSNDSRDLPNLSAAMAFEHWVGRKPYMIEGKRVCIRMPIRHPEHGRLWITNMDREKLTACWYDNPGNRQDGKPKKRFTFTHKELKSQGLRHI